MTCSHCGSDNPAGKRFCGDCGGALENRCPQCGADHPPNKKFCGDCGASFAPQPARATDTAEARKVVTIVFADLVGSTALHERLDAESVRRFMDRYYQAMRGAVDAEGGTVTQLLGDGVMAVFGAPRVAEDDAIRAVRAAVGMQQAFRALADAERGAVGKTGLRIAVNTGEVVASDQSEIIGDPVNVAARLQDQAGDGDVVIGEATRRLVSELVTLAPLGTFALKGRAETVAAYCVVSLERPAGAPATAFVGREDELGRLTAVYETAVTARRARLAVILGSPGLGKSRLLAELARRLGDGATVLSAHCDATGGATFAPIAEAVRAVLRLDAGANADTLRAALDAVVAGDDAERSRIATGIAALLAGTPAPPEETFFVVRRFLGALAVAQPVLLVLDDLQWAEPLLLDLTEHLVQWSTTVPLLILVAARPELRDVRSSLATPGGLVAEVVTLAGLDAGAATRLAANVIGAGELPAAIAGRVLAASEGNPLFVGELVRMLVHDGALKREGDRWTAGVALATLEMPPTIQALLAARIERLGPEERIVLERAAVIGRQFSRAALAHLLPREVTNLNARLESLRRSELVESDTGWFLGEPALRFHHVLIRDAAYRRVLKGTRAELHGRFADWLEARVGEAIEHDETIGWHLERAHQYLRELGPLDDGGRTIGERAARYLAAAGRRALERDDVPLAASLLGRALDRLDAADLGRADLALDWCEALLTAGDVGPAAGAIAELGRFIAGSERLRAWHTCFAGQHAALTNPQALHATADAVAAAAEALAALGDGAGEAKAHAVHAYALGRLGKVGACEAALDRALAAARRANDRRRANGVLAGAPLAALWGPSPVTRASGRCLDVVRVLRITQGAPAVEAVALRCQAVLEALRGRTEAARRMIASSRHLVEELGITQRLLEADMFAGLIDLLEGDAVAAERRLRAVYDGLRAHGLGIDAAQAAALLGRALLALDRAAEAEAMSRESEALAGDDLQAAIAWRGVRAEALACRGEHGAAVDFARAAVEIAAATDALLIHADARLALATALRAAGRTAEGDGEERRALELWEAKGATLLVERARRDGGRGAHVDYVPAERTPMHPARRRVRTNAAVVNARKFEAALAARDADAFATLLADDTVSVDHPNGAELDRPMLIRTWRGYVDVEGLTFSYEPVATLGDSLALCRLSAFGSGGAGRMLDIGAYEIEKFILIEVDAQGRRRRDEVFATNRLADAVTRLYALYAELLPEGAERTRAAATARSLAEAMEGPLLRSDAPDTTFAPDIEFVDHRTVGLGLVRGAEAVRQHGRALWELMEEHAFHLDDVLGLRSDAALTRWTHSGTGRASGGAFERRLCWLWVFGGDGLITRYEQFDAEREDEALARFDELTAEPAAARIVAAPAPAPEERERRVRPNAATSNAARFDTAVARRDADALPTLLADEVEIVHHPTGVVFDRRGLITTWRSLLSARDPTSQHKPLATLGDSLALCRVSTAASGFVGGRFDVGAYETERFYLLEADANGRQRRAEVFAADRLGDAIARLYERHAKLLPDGPARERAVTTARGVAAMMIRTVPLEADMVAPDFTAVDHRTVGYGALAGAGEARRLVEAWRELADDRTFRVDDVLALSPSALLRKSTQFGVWRDGGGRFERSVCMLSVFGPDGRATRFETFEGDHDDEALARFDELMAESTAARPVARRVRANAATAITVRIYDAVAARDADALAALLAEKYELVSHSTGVTYDRQGELASFQVFMTAQDPMCRHEPLATLGDSLMLYRLSMSASGFAGRLFDVPIDVGAYEHDTVNLVEVDGAGRRRRMEEFAPDRLGDAVARLYERYAELLPDGATRTRAAATARSFATWLGWPNIESIGAIGALLAPAVEYIDHRLLGFPSTHGAEAFLDRLRSLTEVAAEFAHRVDDVLGLRPDALLWRLTLSGTDRAYGGAFERQFLQLWVFETDGLLTRCENFDTDRAAEALARFDALTAAQSAPRIENAASRAIKRLADAWHARDWRRIEALFPAGGRIFDRRRMVQLELDRVQFLDFLRATFEMATSRYVSEVIATRGDRLALDRHLIEVRDRDVGATEIESLIVVELDERGERVATVRFDPDDLDAAYAELDDRYAAGEAAPLAAAPAGRWSSAFRQAAAARDVEAAAALLAADFVVHDHSPLGWGSLDRPAYVESLKALTALAPDYRVRTDHVCLSSGGALGVHVVLGTHEGGAFEQPRVTVSEIDAQGRERSRDIYTLDQLDEAKARFAELRPDPLRIPPNAATRGFDRWQEASAAGDWQAAEAMNAPTLAFEDRRRGFLVTGDRQMLLASDRLIGSSRRISRTVLATAGDRLALQHVSVAGTSAIAGFQDVVFEGDVLHVIEVDEVGLFIANIWFDADDRRAASAELRERFARSDEARWMAAGYFEFARALLDRDLDRMRAAIPDDFVHDDHRRTGGGRLEGADATIAWMAALLEQSPDATIENLYIVATEKHATLAVSRTFGTLTDGGEFESVFVRLMHWQGDRFCGAEIFELEDLDMARVRFEELCAAPCSA